MYLDCEDLKKVLWLKVVYDDSVGPVQIYFDNLTGRNYFVEIIQRRGFPANSTHNQGHPMKQFI